MNSTSHESVKSSSHSKPGLISLGLAIITALATLVLFFITFIPESGTFEQIRINQILFVFTLIIAPIPYFTGLILGIVGAFKKPARLIFPLLGIIFNALALGLIIFYWVLIVLLFVALSSLGGWR